MASKAPPIPPDQRSAATEKPDVAGSGGRRGRATADTNLREQGRQGNINQNTHHQGYQQDR
jgi:hypothetical protein